MNKTIVILVNGIMTRPGNSKNWNGRGVTWLHLNTPFKAEKVEYLIGPLSRILGQKMRARKLAKTLNYYKGWQITLVGHSNGCNVILNALRVVDVELKALHLFSAACEEDFEKNGLNAMAGNIGRVFVHMAGNDFAMKLAGSLFGRLIGYNDLGKVGPKNPLIMPEINLENSFGHSDWFKEENFERTMELIAGEEL